MKESVLTLAILINVSVKKDMMARHVKVCRLCGQLTIFLSLLFTCLSQNGVTYIARREISHVKLQPILTFFPLDLGFGSN